MRDGLVDEAVTVPLSIIPTGIDLNITVDDQQKELFRDQYQLDKNIRWLIFVGRLGKEKTWTFYLMRLKN